MNVEVKEREDDEHEQIYYRNDADAYSAAGRRLGGADGRNEQSAATAGTNEAAAGSNCSL